MADLVDNYKTYEGISKENLLIPSLNEKLCQEWLEEKSKTVKPLSFDKYENITYKYILPFLNDHPIDTLNEDIINNYLEKQEQSGMSLNIAKLIKITLRGIYNYGEENYHLSHIDFTNVNARVDKKKRDVLNAHDEKVLYDYCQSHIDSLGASIMLCLYGGLRFSELNALKYGDIDLDEGIVNIDKKVQRNVNRSNNLSKTEFHIIDLEYPEKRKVILSDIVTDYLRNYMTERNENCYLLSKVPILKEQRKYQTELKNLGKKYGFEVNYTILRNTFKQRCIANGVNIGTIMSNLGVSRIEITMDDILMNENISKKKEMGKMIP